MVDSDFKEWMKSELGDLKERMGNMEAATQRNTDTLRNYIWFWRGMKSVALLLTAGLAYNWDNLIKLLARYA